MKTILVYESLKGHPPAVARTSCCWIVFPGLVVALMSLMLHTSLTSGAVIDHQVASC